MTSYNDLYSLIVAPAQRTGPGGHGEEVVYVPGNKPERTIWAKVNRATPDELSAGIRIHPLTVEVINNDETGITIRELNEGRHKIRVAVYLGGQREEKTLGKVVSSDGGVIEITVG